MGKAPAVIVIARHGARLDQADKQWHLTSPTPYDPPLTYGGWTQARALGARIGDILKAREAGLEEARYAARGKNNEVPPVRPRHKIIIHSSPFARCVQTSVAIGAGIAQFRERARPIVKNGCALRDPSRIRRSESRSGLFASQEPANGPPDIGSPLDPASLPTKPDAKSTSKSVPAESHAVPGNRMVELRLDAFLGEWLSPDYFENITPPPSPATMVVTAKAELLRPGEAIAGSDPSRPPEGYFPGGWGMDENLAGATGEPVERHDLANMAALSCDLPNRACATIHGSDFPTLSTLSRQPSPPKRNNARAASSDPSSAAHADFATYLPPTPNYAISTSSPIPVGYVAHARDACVSIAYGWDSMRPPMCWGGGGEYGEEWSSMHLRFRTGLANMIEWYEKHGNAVSQNAEKTADDKSDRGDGDVDGEEEQECDTVVVLVTHGAGCNALLGALTNQPVLLDVGMASLTMAVRKQSAKTTAEKSKERKELAQGGGGVGGDDGMHSSVEVGIAGDYDLRYVASTDHLRAGPNPLNPRPISASGSNPPRRRTAASISVPNKSSFGTGEGIPSFRSTGLQRSISGNSAPRRMRYSSSLAGTSQEPRISSGLWRPSMANGASKSRVDETSRGRETGGLDRDENCLATSKSEQAGNADARSTRKVRGDPQSDASDAHQQYNSTDGWNGTTTNGTKINNDKNDYPHGNHHPQATPTQTPSQQGLWASQHPTITGLAGPNSTDR